MEEKKREFKGLWIPAIVYLNRDVSWNAKIIWLEIDSLQNNDKDCFFSNDYLAKFLNCSVAQVGRYIAELKGVGWVEDVGFDGRKRYLRSTLAYSKMSRLVTHEREPSLLKNDLHNNSNITVPNYQTADSKESAFQKPLFSEEVYEVRITEDKKEKSLYARCVEIWIKEIHPMWTFKAIDGKALNLLIPQLREYSKKKNEVDPSDDRLVDFFKHLCVSLPQFYKNQTLMVINSKFDTIIDEIKTGRSTKKESARDYITRKFAQTN